jgi:hypothetical protein
VDLLNAVLFWFFLVALGFELRALTLARQVLLLLEPSLQPIDADFKYVLKAR